MATDDPFFDAILAKASKAGLQAPAGVDVPPAQQVAPQASASAAIGDPFLDAILARASKAGLQAPQSAPLESPTQQAASLAPSVPVGTTEPAAPAVQPASQGNLFSSILGASLRAFDEEWTENVKKAAAEPAPEFVMDADTWKHIGELPPARTGGNAVVGALLAGVTGGTGTSILDAAVKRQAGEFAERIGGLAGTFFADGIPNAARAIVDTFVAIPQLPSIVAGVPYFSGENVKRTEMARDILRIAPELKEAAEEATSGWFGAGGRRQHGHFLSDPDAKQVDVELYLEKRLNEAMRSAVVSVPSSVRQDGVPNFRKRTVEYLDLGALRPLLAGTPEQQNEKIKGIMQAFTRHYQGKSGIGTYYADMGMALGKAIAQDVVRTVTSPLEQSAANPFIFVTTALGIGDIAAGIAGKAGAVAFRAGKPGIGRAAGEGVRAWQDVRVLLNPIHDLKIVWRGIGDYLVDHLKTPIGDATPAVKEAAKTRLAQMEGEWTQVTAHYAKRFGDADDAYRIAVAEKDAKAAGAAMSQMDIAKRDAYAADQNFRRALKETQRQAEMGQIFVRSPMGDKVDTIFRRWFDTSDSLVQRKVAQEIPSIIRIGEATKAEQKHLLDAVVEELLAPVYGKESAFPADMAVRDEVFTRVIHNLSQAFEESGMLAEFGGSVEAFGAWLDDIARIAGGTPNPKTAAADIHGKVRDLLIAPAVRDTIRGTYTQELAPLVNTFFDSMSDAVRPQLSKAIETASKIRAARMTTLDEALIIASNPELAEQLGLKVRMPDDLRAALEEHAILAGGAENFGDAGTVTRVAMEASDDAARMAALQDLEREAVAMIGKGAEGVAETIISIRRRITDLQSPETFFRAVQRGFSQKYGLSAIKDEKGAYAEIEKTIESVSKRYGFAEPVVVPTEFYRRLRSVELERGKTVNVRAADASALAEGEGAGVWLPEQWVADMARYGALKGTLADTAEMFGEKAQAAQTALATSANSLAKVHARLNAAVEARAAFTADELAKAGQVQRSVARRGKRTDPATEATKALDERKRLNLEVRRARNALRAQEHGFRELEEVASASISEATLSREWATKNMPFALEIERMVKHGTLGKDLRRETVMGAIRRAGKEERVLAGVPDLARDVTREWAIYGALDGTLDRIRSQYTDLYDQALAIKAATGTDVLALNDPLYHSRVGQYLPMLDKQSHNDLFGAYRGVRGSVLEPAIIERMFKNEGVAKARGAVQNIVLRYQDAIGQMNNAITRHNFFNNLLEPVLREKGKVFSLTSESQFTGYSPEAAAMFGGNGTIRLLTEGEVIGKGARTRRFYSTGEAKRIFQKASKKAEKGASMLVKSAGREKLQGLADVKRAAAEGLDDALKEIRRDFEDIRPSDYGYMPDGELYVRVPSDKAQYGELAGKFVPEEMARVARVGTPGEIIRRAEELAHAAGKGMTTRVYNAWKGGMTILNPATQVGNLASNTLLAMVSSIGREAVIRTPELVSAWKRAMRGDHKNNPVSMAIANNAGAGFVRGELDAATVDVASQMLALIGRENLGRMGAAREFARRVNTGRKSIGRAAGNVYTGAEVVAKTGMAVVFKERFDSYRALLDRTVSAMGDVDPQVAGMWLDDVMVRGIGSQYYPNVQELIPDARTLAGLRKAAGDVVPSLKTYLATDDEVLAVLRNARKGERAAWAEGAAFGDRVFINYDKVPEILKKARKNPVGGAIWNAFPTWAAMQTDILASFLNRKPLLAAFASNVNDTYYNAIAKYNGAFSKDEWDTFMRALPWHQLAGVMWTGVKPSTSAIFGRSGTWESTGMNITRMLPSSPAKPHQFSIMADRSGYPGWAPQPWLEGSVASQLFKTMAKYGEFTARGEWPESVAWNITSDLLKPLLPSLLWRVPQNLAMSYDGMPHGRWARISSVGEDLTRAVFPISIERRTPVEGIAQAMGEMDRYRTAIGTYYMRKAQAAMLAGNGELSKMYTDRAMQEQVKAARRDAEKLEGFHGGTR